MQGEGENFKGTILTFLERNVASVKNEEERRGGRKEENTKLGIMKKEKLRGHKSNLGN